MTVETNSAAPAGGAPAPAPVAADVKSGDVKTDGAKPAEGAEPKAEVKPIEEKPAVKDPKEILNREQERRLEARATALRADLTKREAALNAKTAELAKREASLKELSALKEAKVSAKDDPISFLEAFGLTFEEVAKAAASGTGSDPAARKALKESRELRAKLEAKEKAEAEAATKAAQARDAEQKAQTVRNIDSMLKADKKYKYVAQFGSADDVFDAWFETYRATGKMPDVHAVAAKVNEYYKEQAKLAHAAWQEELAAAPKPPEPKKDEPAPKVESKAEPKKEPPAAAKTREDLRGRSRGDGARSYAGEIAEQLKEARKSRGA